MNSLLFGLTVIGLALCGYPEMPLGKHGKQGPPPPPFLRNVTQTAKKEYFDILKRTNETIRQQKEEIMEWGKKYGVEAKVQEFEINMTKHRAEVKQNVTELLARLPAAYQHLTTIMDNEEQTPIQMRDAIGAFKNQSKVEFSVLTFAAGQFRPRKGGPRRDHERSGVKSLNKGNNSH
ncbi:hypothetical protein RB195_001665 [Necator americanus]|uniref:Uncharacterized protein n=2 Tax=Necator americanus TaxID=51031 RepID=A0ABR1DFZ3_NECAM|nr:hypothetical protein NECAME_02051 [Necator americanus]ETN81761.1 hypothetical protein NECAME_02051 [Necator americanus]